MAASMAFAAMTGCAAAPPEKIVPYVKPPEELLPGNPIVFATTMPSNCGYGLGLLVESHEGRPIRLSGNPDHPASLGSTDIFAHASLLGMYDPDRAETVSQNGDISTWDAFVTSLADAMAPLQASRGAGLHILTEAVTSPTLADLLNQLLAKYPMAVWRQYQPAHHDNSREGAKLSFGRFVDAQYRFENADVIVSLDSDFLSWLPGNLNYARNFVARRKIAPGETKMNRLYVVESGITITGAMADHRFVARPTEITDIARGLANGSAQPSSLATVLEDLEAHRGRSIVLAGETQPPEVHALVNLMNSRLGNVGQTVFYTAPVQVNPVNNIDSLRLLTQDMAAGRVSVLVTLGGNPAYTAPADFNFAQQLNRVPLRIHQSLYFDETAELSHWHIPESHYLESWGDLRAWNGTASIIQPLMIPLYETRTPYELVAAMLGNTSQSSYDIVRTYWQKQHAASDFDMFWNEAVRSGVIADSNASEVAVAASTVNPAGEPNPSGNGIDIVFRPDPTVFDGRWANNSWLQELPKPINRLTWDNVASLSETTASSFGVRNSEIIEIKAGGRSIKAPAFITPGCADNCIILTLGYGRHRLGRVGNGRGYNAYTIRTSSSPWIATNAEVYKTGEVALLATTQGHHEMHGRHIVRHA